MTKLKTRIGSHSVILVMHVDENRAICSGNVQLSFGNLLESTHRLSYTEPFTLKPLADRMAALVLCSVLLDLQIDLRGAGL